MAAAALNAVEQEALDLVRDAQALPGGLEANGYDLGFEHGWDFGGVAPTAVCEHFAGLVQALQSCGFDCRKMIAGLQDGREECDNERRREAEAGQCDYD